ncbi:phage regulatory CII family protein [Aeromonas jandaei]|uniref:Phage regulatory CII family protein n=1 Tax=Aeromonas jandaei TaxID=650 RepID=A0A7T4DQC7_AERJA|nr:phage regulatory CII family protein [Aeromonas jandaei]QQB21158.1 phage regulatory CII family protein [Aeromonas jandaei]UCA31970.1 phage regulatory CII family protein [Aeromonas jandaei]
MSTHKTSVHHGFESACDRFKASHNLEDIAAAIGMRPDVLRNKFNPAQTKHKLHAVDLLNIYRVTGDDTLFDGLLFDCGLTAVRLPSSDAVIKPEARAQQALNAGANILGVTAQATQVLSSDRVTKGHRNALVGGLMAGIEHLFIQVIEVEQKFNSVPTLACAADIARASLGA